MKKVKFIQQLSNTSCGLACLAMILDYYGYETNLYELCCDFENSRDGLSIKDIKNIASNFGMDVKAIEVLNFKKFFSEKFVEPYIALTSNAHYIVVEKHDEHNVIFIDPEKGRMTENISEFMNNASGIVIFCSPNEKFTKKKKYNSFFKILKIGEIDIKRLCYISLISIVVQSLTLLLPLVTRYIIDDVISRREMYRSGIIISIFSLIIFYALFSLIRTKLIITVEKKYIFTLKDTIVSKIFTLPMKFFDSRSSGEIVSRINHLDSLEKIISSGISSLLIDLSTVVIAFIAMALMSVYFTLIIMFFAMFLFVVLYFLLKKLEEKNSNFIRSKELTQGYLMEIFSNLLFLKVSARGDVSYSKWKEMFSNELRFDVERENYLNIFQTFISVYRLLPNVLILILGSIEVQQHTMSLGSLMSFLSLVSLVLSPIALIVQNCFQFQFCFTILDRVFDIIYTPEEKNKFSISKMPALKRITFSGLNFSYGSGSKVIDDIALTIRRGERIAIVGKTGCGKTTLIKLLLRLYEVEEGTVLYNDNDINLFDLNSYRKNFGVVLQNDVMFNDTILSNIDLTHSHSMEDIITAANLAKLDTEINNMPMGYYTSVGDNGNNLSGGQRQRLAIARAILQNPEIIIFDEGTGQLDSITEKQIMDNLKYRGITQIFITHRLSNAKEYDSIVVMDNGKIIDIGKHDELCSKEGMYKRLFEASHS
ncbi:peptidase domain-containing ABC transporter [Streptococcus suis]|uniref:peptidase domain-containing ABC transporter n=1 Tax=Streptococcus suis TaxID=1307 RepID=UPI0003FE9D5C|nr:peptidase domain-containing ABC transporter [Streptococcus suis 10581]